MKPNNPPNNVIEKITQNPELTVKKMLSQPGQFATGNEKLTLVGPKGQLQASVLGPVRKANQIELSFTDARALGLKDVPVRESGDVAGTPGLTIIGPCGQIEVTEGVMITESNSNPFTLCIVVSTTFIC